jgi:hypothetical protein
MAGSGDKWQVLYSDGPPADPIRLGQLLVDESEADPMDMLKVCTDLSPVTYASLSGAGGGTVDSVVPGTGIDVDSTDPANPIVSIEPGYLDTVSYPAQLGYAGIF